MTGWLDQVCDGPHVPVWVRTWGRIGYLECQHCGLMIGTVTQRPDPVQIEVVEPEPPAPGLVDPVRQERDRQILLMRQQGRTLAEIATATGLHFTRVSQIITRSRPTDPPAPTGSA